MAISPMRISRCCSKQLFSRPPDAEAGRWFDDMLEVCLRQFGDLPRGGFPGPSATRLEASWPAAPYHRFTILLVCSCTLLRLAWPWTARAAVTYSYVYGTVLFCLHATYPPHCLVQRANHLRAHGIDPVHDKIANDHTCLALAIAQRCPYCSEYTWKILRKMHATVQKVTFALQGSPKTSAKPDSQTRHVH